MVDFANRLKTLRTERRLTQLQVAERIGVTKAMISAYETETRYPSYDVLIKIARTYNVTTDYLLGLDSRQVIVADGLNEEEIGAVAQMVSILRKRWEV